MKEDIEALNTELASIQQQLATALRSAEYNFNLTDDLS